MLVGVADDGPKSVDVVRAKAKLDLMRLAGFDTLRLTTVWAPGQTQPAPVELEGLRTAAAAANIAGVRIVLSVYHAGSRTTPRTPLARRQFSRFAASLARELPTVRHFVIGNEPNLNRFWMPQFTWLGRSRSPADYLALLAPTYDALKAVSRGITVVGGALAPRGADNPYATRHTHSPGLFLRELGQAYRASRRRKPIMDWLAFHPYGEHSSQPPEFRRHPRSKTIGLNDYGKLVKALRQAFDGTRQRGATLPILYAEYGIEAAVPFERADAYTGREHTTTRPVSELTQGNFYRRALALARCQPTVKGFLLFLLTDEPALDRWQSGLLYPDDSPKTSFAAVRDAVTSVRAPGSPCGLPPPPLLPPPGIAVIPPVAVVPPVTLPVEPPPDEPVEPPARLGGLPE